MFVIVKNCQGNQNYQDFTTQLIGTHKNSIFQILRTVNFVLRRIHKNFPLPIGQGIQKKNIYCRKILPNTNIKYIHIQAAYRIRISNI